MLTLIIDMANGWLILNDIGMSLAVLFKLVFTILFGIRRSLLQSEDRLFFYLQAKIGKFANLIELLCSMQSSPGSLSRKSKTMIHLVYQSFQYFIKYRELNHTIEDKISEQTKREC